ncbi:MAG: ArsC family transcriptional regulator [Defluviitaleaceae bacterium]|nr:ArsC family transcriptional regulator [Defluviitaleaceae bacterium]
MNIQIFGKAKCFDTKKAERFFKERGIKYQYIDLLKYGISKGEFASVKSACKGTKNLLDEKHGAYKNILAWGEANAEEYMLANPEVLKTPIVRNGRLATVGNSPEVWSQWLANK